MRPRALRATVVSLDLAGLMETAKANLARDGYLAPVLIVEAKTAPLLIAIEEMPATSALRAELLRTIGARLASRRPRAAALVIDAYVNHSEGVTGSFADDPGSTECLVVAFLTADGRPEMLLCTYERLPLLSGLEIEYKAVEPFESGAQLYLLEAFFEGVAGSLGA